MAPHIFSFALVWVFLLCQRLFHRVVAAKALNPQLSAEAERRQVLAMIISSSAQASQQQLLLGAVSLSLCGYHIYTCEQARRSLTTFKEVYFIALLTECLKSYIVVGANMHAGVAMQRASKIQGGPSLLSLPRCWQLRSAETR